jgi:hypothetical protein
MIRERVELVRSPIPTPGVNRVASTDDDDMHIDNFGNENYSTSTMR